MSKRHHRHQGNGVQDVAEAFSREDVAQALSDSDLMTPESPEAPSVPADEAEPTETPVPEVPAEETPSEIVVDQVGDMESPAEGAAPEVEDPDAEEQPEEAAPAVEPPKTEPVVAEVPVGVCPTPAEVKTSPQPVQKSEARRVTGEDVLPSTSPILKARMNIPARKTTPQGQRLASLFDDYALMMQQPTNDREELKKRVLKLYQIMTLGCPTSLRDSIIATDLVRVAFDKLAAGWGTTFKENTMFQLDYTLPGGAAAIDKLNMYWAALIQLVEAALYNKRIMFDDNRLASVLKSPIIASAISKMKANIIERNRDRPPAV